MNIYIFIYIATEHTDILVNVKKYTYRYLFVIFSMMQCKKKVANIKMPYC